MPSDILILEKERVRRFWEAEPCGSRYLEQPGCVRHEGADQWTRENFEAHSRIRHALEPHIIGFAQFETARRKKVLEIGVGMGADFLEWLKAGAQVTGVDISLASIERTRLRCELAGYSRSDLHVADAENLPFPNSTFDVVYSYGVMHHSPDTPRCIQEARRVLKHGGEARIMLYHHPSVTGMLLWLRYGIGRGKCLRECVYDYLESPGTKTYTREEVISLMEGFRNVRTRLVFSPGDLLLHAPSKRFQSQVYRMFWSVYPRWLVKRAVSSWKLFILVTGTKED